MGGARAEQSLCACYREYQEFQKVVELKNSGLVVYCHTTRKNNGQPDELIGTSKSVSKEAFVIHNTRDVKITPSDMKVTLETSDISCPRCRQIFEHAQELLQKVKLIDRKNIMGVCDHCLKKAQSIKAPCRECEEIAKKFISTRDKQKEDTKRCIKIWLSKMNDFLKDTVTPKKKVKSRASSDLQIDQLIDRCKYSPKSRREPEVKQMFYPETRKSDTNLYKETDDINLIEMLEKSVVFAEAIESVETPGIIDTKTAGPWLVDSTATLGEPTQHAKLRDSTLNVRESLKTKHDLSLRHMIRTEKKPKTPKTFEIYEIPKIAPWEQETTTKHSDASEIEVKLSTEPIHGLSSKKILSTKGELTSHIPKYDTPIKRDLKLETLKHTRSRNLKTMYDSEEVPKKIKKREHRLTDDQLKYQRSVPKFSPEIEKLEQQITKTKIKDKKHVDYVLRKQFSYFFPKTLAKKEKILGARSSQLIKNTQERLRQRAEEEKKRQEEERKYQLEEEEKKKLAREEKKRFAEEKKKLQIEDQKKLIEVIKYTETDSKKKTITDEEKGQYTPTDDKPTREKDKEDELVRKRTKDGKFKSEHIDEIPEKPKKESMYKTEDSVGKLSQKAKKDLKSKPDQIDTVFEKYKKEKSKSGQREDIHDVSEKYKKDLKAKPESKEKKGDITLKPERKDELTERPKRDLKSKSETRDKTNEVSEKGKKELLSKPELINKLDKDADKRKKDKAEVNKEGEISQKEKLKREKEDKERLAQVAKLRKEREAALLKKQDTAREEESAKKRNEDKKASSKKSDEMSKENVEPHKKRELAKKLKDPSAGTESPLKTKEWTSKELQDFTKKRPDEPKETIAVFKKGTAKEVTEPSKKQRDAMKERAVISKGKEVIPKKEEPAKVKEESAKDVAGKVDSSKKPKDGTDEAQFRKLQAEYAKQKEQDLKNKKLKEAEEQKLKELAEKRAREEQQRKPNVGAREAKAVIKPEPEKPPEKPVKEKQESTMKELKIQNIKIRNTSSDDLILKLVRIKQTATKQTIKPCDIDPQVVKAHRCHHKSGLTSSLCELCNDSELEIDLESYENKLNLKKEVTEIIIGEKIFKRKPPCPEKIEEPEVIPILFQSMFHPEPLPPPEIVQFVPPEPETVKKPILANFLQSKDKGLKPMPFSEDQKKEKKRFAEG